MAIQQFSTELKMPWDNLKPACERAIIDPYDKTASIASILGNTSATLSALMHTHGVINCYKDLGGGRIGLRRYAGWVFGKPMRLSELQAGGFLQFETIAHDPMAIMWHVGSCTFGDEDNHRERLRYVLNAARKLPYLYKHFGTGARSTLELTDGRPIDWGYRVKSIEDDGVTMLWGQFPFGGAVMVIVDDWVIPVSVSGFDQIEDDIVARMLAWQLGYYLRDHRVDQIVESAHAA